MSATEDFWEFASQTYEVEGVSGLCLRLQDEYELDVNILLFILWCDQMGAGDVSPQFWKDLVSYSKKWQGEIVSPLRGARRELKVRIANGLPHLQKLRQQVLSVELEAEKEQINHLQHLYNVSPTIREVTAQEMIRCYLSALKLEADDTRDHLLKELVLIAV
ncbi:MAG: TIGR02444 family protein [Sneathiella sp.]|nr:TIGR02444 family protein [Sneathiella sp.]